jgi:hypothetical protein
VEQLTEGRRSRLIELVVTAFRNADIAPPDPAESEVAYTRRCLAPLLSATIKKVRFPGIIPLGSGSASMISCHVLGGHFYPDLGIGYLGKPVLAIEVKLLRGVNRQNAIATAIGQGLLYAQRFNNAMVMIIDTLGRLSDEEILAGEVLLSGAGLPLIVRRVRTSLPQLVPHPLS